MEKNKQQKTRKKRVSRESITAFKKELKSLSMEPIYGESLKDILARLTSKLEEVALSYGYEIEFPERAKKEVEGDVYYFIYPIKVKTKHGEKRLTLEVEYMLYEEGRWMGIITDVL
ncbi:hypothetical protein SUSAZ_11150 [Sulfolobus acidocaldarius SUSAZ]|nr:hypothetical protein SUSAZ_11150 [Sulfolobus acidocaldarius SUSAZ]